MLNIKSSSVVKHLETFHKEIGKQFKEGDYEAVSVAMADRVLKALTILVRLDTFTAGRVHGVLALFSKYVLLTEPYSSDIEGDVLHLTNLIHDVYEYADELDSRGMSRQDREAFDIYIGETEAMLELFEKALKEYDEDVDED